jgi:hypothetical protein
VWNWINAWATAIFRTPAGQRVEAKRAVEECIQSASGEGSMLQRIIAKWFKNNPNPNKVKREGELTKLRELRPKRVLGLPRTPSVVSISDAGNVQMQSSPMVRSSPTSTQRGTPTPMNAKKMKGMRKPTIMKAEAETED